MVDRGFEPWSGQTKDYEIGICCFSTKHSALSRKSKYWLAWNQDIVWFFLGGGGGGGVVEEDISTHGLLIQ